MNDTLNTIMSRRSIRKFSSTPVTVSEINKLLRAACNAPSASNRQTWDFIVIQKKTSLSFIATELKHAKFAESANIGILVCGSTAVESKVEFVIENCSAAIENILLAAQSIGLGACWCGVHPIEHNVVVLRDLFNIPLNTIPIGLVLIGHPIEQLEPIVRYDENKIHYDTW